MMLVAVVLTAAACRRAGVEPPPPPPNVPGPDAAEMTEPIDRSDRSRPGDDLPEPPADVERYDPILHVPAAQDRVLLERTAFWKDFWTGRSQDYFGRYLERMGRYDGLVDRELEARGLPESLRYLPLVESGYHPGVSSRVGATGMWQLMPPTARELGLEVSGVVDDRRDPVGATTAALDYLSELHERFDSWLLALSAYNAGPGRVGRLLRLHAPDEDMPADDRYLLIRPHLPAETREFVPRFFAAAELASDPEAHGFPPVDRSRPLLFDEVTVPDATSLDVIALAADVGEDEIEDLNPQFPRGFTPAGAERVVRVPEGAGEVFEENYARIPPEHRVSFMEHVVASGETLTHIARRYGVSIADLDGSNRGLDPRRLQIGQRIVVPVGGGGLSEARAALARESVDGGPGTAGTEIAQADVAGADADTSTATADGANGGAEASDEGGSGGRTGSGSGGATRRHVVESGESLWSIARRYEVGIAQLRRLNGLPENDVLQPGQELLIADGVRIHRVRPGETWSGIARRYGVTTSALAQANGRTTRDVIRAGEDLRIP